MDMVNAIITGVGGYVPEDVITNADIERLVETSDEWITSRVGIKERRVLKGELGTSFMGTKATRKTLKQLSARLPPPIIRIRRQPP